MCEKLFYKDKFNNYVLSLNRKDKRMVILRICMVCDIHPATVHNWRSGNTEIPKLARDKIVEVVGHDIFSANIT